MVSMALAASGSPECLAGFLYGLFTADSSQLMHWAHRALALTLSLYPSAIFHCPTEIGPGVVVHMSRTMAIFAWHHLKASLPGMATPSCTAQHPYQILTLMCETASIVWSAVWITLAPCNFFFTCMLRPGLRAGCITPSQESIDPALLGPRVFE